MSVEITINGKRVSVQRGQTLLEVCHDNDFPVPSLCHSPLKKHHAACGVCQVLDEHSGLYLTACNTPAKEGQSILTDSEDVRTKRRKALNLLLLEHRGDCTAPCQRSCPYGFPVMELMVCAEDDLKPTEELLSAFDPETCRSCSAPCEKACRRNIQEQKPLPCRERILSFYKSNSTGDRARERRKVFSPSRIGKLPEEEYRLWLQQRPVKVKNGRCLRCGCVSADGCKLLELSREYRTTVKKGGITTSNESLIYKAWGALLYNPGKCIRCGRCTAADDAVPQPVFISRGSAMEMTLAGEEPTYEQSRLLKAKCPTGALSLREVQ